MSTWIHVGDRSFAIEHIRAYRAFPTHISIDTGLERADIWLEGEEAIEFDYKFSLLTGRLMSLGLKASDQQKAQWWEEGQRKKEVLGQNSTYLRQIAQNLISLTQAVEEVGGDNQISTEIDELRKSLIAVLEEVAVRG